MSTPLEDKLRVAALATPALVTRFGSSPFRWFDKQLIQGSAFPAVCVLSVVSVPSYVFEGRNLLTRNRMQFTVYDPNPETARAAADDIATFLDTFNPTNSAARACTILAQRGGMDPDPTRPLHAEILDVQIFNEET